MDDIFANCAFMLWGSKVSASTTSALTVTALTACSLRRYVLTVSALTDAVSTFPVLTVSVPSVSVITVYAWASVVLVVHVLAVSGWSVYAQKVLELAVLFHVAVVLNKSVIRCMHANDIHRSHVPGHAAAYRARPGDRTICHQCGGKWCAACMQQLVTWIDKRGQAT